MYISIVSEILKSLGYEDIVEGCYDLGVYGLELGIIAVHELVYVVD